jgi:hypothetical protein
MTTRPSTMRLKLLLSSQNAPDPYTKIQLATLIPQKLQLSVVLKFNANWIDELKIFANLSLCSGRNIEPNLAKLTVRQHFRLYLLEIDADLMHTCKN